MIKVFYNPEQDLILTGWLCYGTYWTLYDADCNSFPYMGATPMTFGWTIVGEL